jgi:formylglycine-generating enzyme required for sulfatase activity
VVNDNTTNYHDDSNTLEPNLTDTVNSLISPLQIVPYPFETAHIKVRKHKREIVIDYQDKQESQCIEKIDNINLELVKISAGKFRMGAIKDEYGIHILNTGYPHDVDVPEFYIGKYPVTQQQWKFGANLPKINRELVPNPSEFEGEDLPVEQVSWDDAIEFCARLSYRTGRDYRLPSEAEWEYACRAGKDTPFHFGETIDSRLSNYNGDERYGLGEKGEYRRKTTPIRKFQGANTYGLYDMHGNVKEWCQDSWHENYLNAPTDGSAWLTPESSKKVLRGGSYCNDPKDCRSDARCYEEATHKSCNLGFRLAMSVKTLVAPLVQSPRSFDLPKITQEMNIESDPVLGNLEKLTLCDQKQVVSDGVEIFFSYTHKDEELRDKLATHLSALRREGVIKEWHDRKIGGGKEWAGEIDRNLETAHIILLLISADFINSDYCIDKELKRAMERHESNEARVIPIILRPVDWQGMSFRKLQALPKDAKPVTSWSDSDEAFLNIAKGIRSIVTEIIKNSKVD